MSLKVYIQKYVLNTRILRVKRGYFWKFVKIWLFQKTFVMELREREVNFVSGYSIVNITVLSIY